MADQQTDLRKIHECVCFDVVYRKNWLLVLSRIKIVAPLLLSFSVGLSASAQQVPASNIGESNTVTDAIRRLPKDQIAIWKAPFSLKAEDTSWLVPGIAASSILFGTDAEISKRALRRTDFLSRANTFSNAGIAGMAGITAGMYLWGRSSENERRRETGLLAGEAAINSAVVTELFKIASNRKRPIDGGTGRFFTGGQSFFSEHSSAAWSVATVVGNEYPGILTKILMYGGASAISAARVASARHFASDALIGSAVGYGIGRQIYKSHHDPELGGEWGTFQRSHERRPSVGRLATFVPLDSWVYDVFDRLSASGVVRSAITGLRPWTRSECVRLLHEAESADLTERPMEAQLVQALSREFAHAENPGVANIGGSIEQVYAREMYIAGPPLIDGFYAGRTIVNDFGRPFGQGANTVVGLESTAFFGSLSFFVRPELQQAGTGRARPAAFDDEIRRFDNVQFPTPLPLSDTTRVDALEAYAGWTVDAWQVSFGKQALQWGPGLGGSMMISNNAEPFPMFRISRTEPGRLPWILGLMGPVRADFFVGQLAGHVDVFVSPTVFGPNVAPQPFVTGQKLSFKPTPNFEFGVSLTSVFGGPQMPFTTRNFFRALYSGSNAVTGTINDVGDRRSGVDLSYRLPGFRDWATVYVDSMADDWISPLANPRRSVFRTGIYLPKLPKLHKADFRFEGGYTDMPDTLPRAFAYTNGRYRNGFTLNGQLLANWMGRDTRGLQGWASYAVSSASKIRLAYRKAIVDPEFIGGGNYTDYSATYEFSLRRSLSATISGQYETWQFPLLSPDRERNFTTTVQLNYHLRWNKENSNGQ
jgi:membrane-associated phospholipid phosphatase